jgi:adenine-specific DNA-methyltransferase
MAKKGAKKKRPIEQYDHSDKTRTNNPPVGLVSPETDKDGGPKTYQYDPHIDPALQFDSQGAEVENIIDVGLSAASVESDEPEELKAALAAARESLSELKKRREPYLNWAGKAERTSFDVDMVSLHVHERIDPRTIVEATRKRNGGSGKGSQLLMFEQPEQNPPLRQAIEFYQHEHNWTNRMIAGDSLLVMNSLLEKEGMAGKVQMIYIDPPYGIRYGSNFQPFVNRREVKDGKDEDLTQEPETLKAFRDTWELGIHSYLTYLRDRLILARELLHDSGSVFVQIGDENLHLVRDILDDVFGPKNFLSIVTVSKTGSLTGEYVSSVADYLLWYGKSKSTGVKYRKLFDVRPERDADDFSADPLKSDGFRSGTTFDYEFDGREFKCGQSEHWKVTRDGLDQLTVADRLVALKKSLRFKRYYDDFPVKEFSNIWQGLGGASGIIYTVQTNRRIVERCMLMTTDPGDLVFDPTCGSGTTAYVAEQWGRRWITCDTSRVAITLAKQRLMTAVFDYYKLAHADEGIGSGFDYKTVPHVTLKSIANNPAIKEGMTRKQIDAAITKYADQETLYDQPEIDKSKARVTGPFTVEAVPAVAVRPLQTVTESSPFVTDP